MPLKDNIEIFALKSVLLKWKINHLPHEYASAMIFQACLGYINKETKAIFVRTVFLGYIVSILASHVAV